MRAHRDEVPILRIPRIGSSGRVDVGGGRSGCWGVEFFFFSRLRVWGDPLSVSARALASLWLPGKEPDAGEPPERQWTLINRWAGSNEEPKTDFLRLGPFGGNSGNWVVYINRTRELASLTLGGLTIQSVDGQVGSSRN